MKQYKLVDNIFGWVAFIIAAFVYCSTIEPTASFWDCPEFITTAYKQEIGHPPGAPFFMLLGNFFTHFASDTTQVAKMVNTMSALLSAVCIMFLFWTITHLARKLIIGDWKEMTTGKLIAIEASGMVGALIYTFSDTFWFSAVEGEVYAFSSAFTAVVFWLILKWEDHADEPHSDRWLVLIAYMTGLSIGVHLLNLLCIPAIVLVYYYKKVPQANLKGSLLALVLSFLVVVAVLYGVVPGIITVGGWFELFFVNVLGCPFNTGEIVYIICLVASVIWGIYETYNASEKNEKKQNIAFVLGFGMLGIPFYGYGWTAVICGVIVLAALWFALNYKRKKEITTGVDEVTGITKKKMQVLPLISARIKNTALLCMLMLMIGYSSYALIVIRSSANPPMDQNSPEDIFTLGSYLSRDQYGDRPLFYGQAYTSQVALEVDGNMCKPVMKEGAPVYQRKEKASADEKDSYFVVSHKNKYVYAQNMLFPRMYSSAHASAYEDWMGGVEGSQVPYDRCGESIMVKVPSQIDNIRFFLSYQCNFMYWRYFMWNFAGRQNDIQGNGEPEHGNWISGFSFIDDALYGDQSKLPDDLKANKGHNVFYCMPLILGLIGLFWQAWYTRKRKVMKNGVETEETLPIGIQQFWVVFFLFFMTGLAIVIYLNQTPMQPRERDYAYAGSFYAYAIWCGLGVLAIINLLKQKMKLSGTAVSAIVAVITLLVPIQMASQTWDDHDRSNRYTCRDFGQNYLMSLWKKASPEHIMRWPSPWSDGFPGWHCECTAMGRKYLGSHFDIHGGGMDLIFPHHECEIAQAVASQGDQMVRYWMHNNMITINGQKMGKSLGNFITLEQFFTGNHDSLEQAYSPMTIRFFILSAHYRSTVDFSNDALKASQKGLERLMNGLNDLERVPVAKQSDEQVKKFVSELRQRCYDAMNDDFQTQLIISYLFEACHVINTALDHKANISAEDLKELSDTMQLFTFDLLGLKSEKGANNDAREEAYGKVVDMVLDLRAKAKAAKDWATSDQIRDALAEAGFEVKDTKDGVTWKLNK